MQVHTRTAVAVSDADTYADIFDSIYAVVESDFPGYVGTIAGLEFGGDGLSLYRWPMDGALLPILSAPTADENSHADVEMIRSERVFVRQSRLSSQCGHMLGMY